MKRRYATIFAQFDTILGSFRSASEKGACPVACYITAISRCIDLASQTSRTLEHECVIKLINALFAPRGMGGWGIPHICGWLTQETPDDLLAYTTTSTFYEVARDSLVNDKIASMFESTMNQELDEVDVTLLLSNPRGVYMKGVTNPSGSVFSKLKEGMISKCESQIFKQALEANTTKPVKDAIKGLLSNVRIDANILELLGQCLPEVCISAIIDRAYKNELISQLFPFRVREKLSRIIRKGGRAAINHLVYLEPATNFDIPSRSTAFDKAENLRNRSYDINEVNVTNHTLPDYNTCLARQATSSAASLVVKMLGPRGSCSTECTNYHNFYDGINPRKVAPKKKTESAFTFTSEPN
ncbi:hypothetical protein B7P43_G05957 [Cryptotermes secundus]|uniref:Uncharacterized protein n=1 Tax=Cryptotermes secundus TaxID=105785 RepID=A0A2J7PZT3_9NEOP|nr:hypothetical protein B7P43_G05957 [Cryptotermes secundus]